MRQKSRECLGIFQLVVYVEIISTDVVECARILHDLFTLFTSNKTNKGKNLTMDLKISLRETWLNNHFLLLARDNLQDFFYPNVNTEYKKAYQKCHHLNKTEEKNCIKIEIT